MYTPGLEDAKKTSDEVKEKVIVAQETTNTIYHDIQYYIIVLQTIMHTIL